MSLVSIKFKGCRRFVLGPHETVIYTPMSVEQVILGSNGAGKSFLLSEIYNIVPSEADFVAGGSKEYVAQLGSSLIRATTTFTSKAGHHTFELSEDGETWIELNESGLQTDQHALCRQYFNYDQDIADLMTDRIKFSRMDPTERRKWLMRICGTDFDFVNELHANLKKKHRDLKGTIDVLSENLGDALKDIMSIADSVTGQAEELQGLEELTSDISRRLEDLPGRKDSSQVLRERIKQSLVEIGAISSAMPALLKKRRSEYSYLPIDELNRMRWDKQDSVSELRGRAKALQDRLHDVQTAIDAIGRDNLKEPSNVAGRISQLEDELSQFTPADIPDEGDTAERLLEMVNSAELAVVRLQPIMTEMPFVEDVKGLKEAYGQATLKQTALNQEFNELTAQVQTYQVRVDHYHHADDVDCPQCSTRFKPGLDATLIGKFEEKIKRLRAREAEILIELGNLGPIISDYDQLVSAFRQYREVVAQHQILDGFWKQIDEERLYFKSPWMVVTYLSDYAERLKRKMRYRRLSDDLLKQQTIMASLEGDTGHLLELAEKLEGELFDMTSEWHKQQAEVKAMDSDLDLYANCVKEAEKFNGLMANYVAMVKELHSTTKVEFLSDVRKQANVRIATLHGLQNRHKSLTDRIATLNDQIDQAKAKFEVYKILDKATSPTEGIVADIVKQFMDTFLEGINSHIGKVWSYDMFISAAPDKGKFTCQFPLHVGSNDRPPSDFKVGSTGQVSMVDFAFKLVVFELEGLKNMPLLADEFGKDFDDEHREKLVSYIRNLIEEKKFCQLFMVSHYSSVYSAFDLAEFVVLDARNITVPAEYNTSIEFV